MLHEVTMANGVPGKQRKGLREEEKQKTSSLKWKRGHVVC